MGGPRRRRPPLRTPWLILLLLPLSAAASAQDRTVQDVRWERRTVVGPVLDGPLVRPLLFAARGDRLYVFDYGEMSLKGLSMSGELLWTVGRRGEGPVEFVNPTDLQIGPRGDVWILDPPNLRITVFSPTGRVRRMIRTRTMFHRVIPLADGSWYGVGPADDATELAVLMDASGREIGSVPFPPEIREAHRMARESVVAPLPRGKGGVVAFRYSDRLLGLDAAANLRFAVRGVERQPFPEVVRWKLDEGAVATRLDPQAVPGALSVSVDGSDVFVQYGGLSGDAGRVVDVYDVGTGAYRASLIMPPASGRLIQAGDRFVVWSMDPLPRVDVLGKRPG